MLLKVAVILAVTGSLSFAAWKNSVGIFVPLICIWLYGFYDGFKNITFTNLIVLSIIHLLIQLILFWYSNKYREAHLAFTGAGITGFATGILASIFFGGLLGFFTWWGLIGRIITQPVAIGFKPILKSFLAGFAKIVYAVIMSGIVSYMIF